MKSKWRLVAAIVQLSIGLLAVASFVVIAINEENMAKWSITLVLAIAYIVLGVLGILDYVSHA